MTGSGNDFVMLDERYSSAVEWGPEAIRAVCARGTGIGADGLVFVGPGTTPGAVRMTYFNSDGSRAMCGNAALCTTWLAAHLGFANPLAMRLETDGATYDSRCSREDGRAELRFTPIGAPRAVSGVALDAGERRAALAVVGVPHLVIEVEDLDGVDVGARGRLLRHDPSLGPEGANVNFVAVAPGAPAWRMRTYERGVEGETLACGTGAIAVACAVEAWGAAGLPLAIGTRSARVLEVRGRRAAQGYEDVWLVGEARLVFRGVVI
jgi:diaminopimelate epimerase